MRNRPQTQNANLFRLAVEATADVANCYQSGLQALGNYSRKIEATSLTCDGSIDIDACTRVKYPQESRWDYAISFNSKVYFVEVHSANSGEVATVLRKLQWLKDWLNSKAPELKKLQANENAFFGLQSKNYNILPGSSQARQLAFAKLKPIPKLKVG